MHQLEVRGINVKVKVSFTLSPPTFGICSLVMKTLTEILLGILLKVIATKLAERGPETQKLSVIFLLNQKHPFGRGLPTKTQ